MDYRISNNKNLPYKYFVSLNEFVTYEWEGNFPELKVLNEMKNKNQRNMINFQYLIWLSPIILIILGAVWILRTRWQHSN